MLDSALRSFSINVIHSHEIMPFPSLDTHFVFVVSELTDALSKYETKTRNTLQMWMNFIYANGHWALFLWSNLNWLHLNTSRILSKYRKFHIWQIRLLGQLPWHKSYNSNFGRWTNLFQLLQMNMINSTTNDDFSNYTHIHTSEIMWQP